MQNTENTIYFNFSYFALKLLGKGLYSNHWTAISELVANSLDAQATKVKIFINMVNKESSTIEIFDNGIGMNYDDIANKYVLIGKDKREDNTVSQELKEQFMGRKGIGKLAALFLSNKYYLISKTENTDEEAWCLDASNVNESDIPHLNKCKTNEINIGAKEEWDKFRTGTMIKLTNVNLSNFGVKSIEAFKARLADFYLLDELNGKIEVSIITNNTDEIVFEEVKKSIAFKNMCVFYSNVFLEKEKILAKYIKMPSDISEIAEKKRTVEIVPDDMFGVTGEDKFYCDKLGEITLPYKMSGWIGIHTSIKKEDAIKNDENFLKNKTYRPNQLRLYVRKKLAVENFLDYIKNTQAFSNYIEGEISFDILDNNDLDDIATSNRQGFVEDDKRIILLVNLLKPIINYLIRQRVKLGNEVNADEKEYREKEKIEAQNKQKEETERRKKAEEKLVWLNKDLGSEKKRNEFLVDSLGEDQVNFAKRIHMLKTNTTTISKIIKAQIMKLQRGNLKNDDVWEALKKLSYLTMRIQSILRYGGLAKFDMRAEFAEGNIFEFIREYCEKILQNDEILINVNNINNDIFQCKFVPQDIAIILDNVFSNSLKAKAKNIVINLRKVGKCAEIDIMDDGKGIDNNIKNVNELFEFGKSFTTMGTGVGLYHIKNIVEKNMHGNVNINANYSNGFELQIRICEHEK